MNRNFAIILAAPLMLCGAAKANPTYDSAAPIAYMIDLSSGAILFDKDSDRQIPPASMAKMMSAYVVMDKIKNGSLPLNKKITVTPEIWQKWNNQGSTMFLASGEQVSVENLMHGMVTLSGNDASVALAVGISGSEEAFVAEMNKTAKRIGLKNSRFGTANGWPDEGRTMVTAQDLAILARRTIEDFPDLYAKFYGKKEFTWGGITQPDRNPLLGKIAGADGLKTGHTEEAGYCFTGTAVQNGRRLILVVAGLDSYNGRITESTNFMNWGFSAWTSKPVFKKGDAIADIPVQLGSETSLKLTAPRNMAVTMPADKASGYKLLIRYKGPVKAPIAMGDQVASLVVKLNDGSEQVSPLYAGEAVAEAGFFGRVWNGLKSLFSA
ncbi:D-alanyl-D-alanine carboxypeptidase family protein [Sphingorhabdus arenilitoris]|uniref:serine-type D-Ala-D-Ala carboxypeptidase n=1 Tax=Sphingorhabdus arenilitoris TaxID=1490041 RepID=A0ABV8RFT4_9SPHN